MFRSTLQKALVLVVMCISIGLGRFAQGHEPSNLADIRAVREVTVRFYEGMISGTAEDVRKISVGSPEALEAADACGRLGRTIFELKKVVEQQHGDNVWKMLEAKGTSFKVGDVLSKKRLDSQPVVLEGDKAFFWDPKDKEWLVLRRVDGAWRVDVDVAFAKLLDGKGVKIYKRYGDGLEDIIRRVKERKIDIEALPKELGRAFTDAYFPADP